MSELLHTTARNQNAHTASELALEETIAQLSSLSAADRERLNAALADYRYSTEWRIRERDQQLRLVFEAARMGSWDWLPATNAQIWSPELELLFGINNGSGVHTIEEFYQLVHPEDLPGLERVTQQAIAEGREVMEAEFRVIRPDGMLLWCASRARLHRDANGQVQRVTGVNTDISSRKQAEQALQHSKENLALALATAQMGTWDWDILNETYVWNATQYAIFGLDPQTFVISVDQVWELIHNEDREALKRLAVNALESGQPYQCEFRVLRPDGEVRWCIGAASVTHDHHGRAIRMSGITYDITERKHNEVMLRESEARFRSIADAAPVMIWIADITSRCIWFNQSWLNYSGRSLEQEYGDGWVEGVHPQDREACVATYLSAFDARQPFSMDYRMRRHDGVYRWLLDYGVPYFAPDQTFLGYIGSCIDITDRREAEVALQRANERFRIAEEASNGFIYDWDVINNQVERSEGFTSVLGYAQHEVPATNDGWRALMHPDDLALLLPHVAQLETQVLPSSSREYRVRHKQGHWIWVLDKHAAMYREGKIWRIVGSTVDITDRKVAEEALRLSQAQHLAEEQEHAARLQQLNFASLLLNAAPTRDEVLRRTTEEARVLIGSHMAVTSTTINQNWAQAINQISLSDKYAQSANYELWPDGAGLYSLVCQTNRPVRLTQAELQAHPAWKGHKQHAGQQLAFRGWLAAPLIARDGQNIGLIQLSDKEQGEFTAADEALLQQLAQIASVALENQTLYEQEQAARTQAEEASRLKDEFLATVSHELRTPLTAFLGYAQMLQSRKRDEAYITRTVEKMVRSARAQAQLIEDLLDISRIVSGKLRIEPQIMDLIGVIRAALDTVRPAVEAKNLQLVIELDPSASTIIGDANRLQQVVWNLLSNASKFTPAGGTIRVQLARQNYEAELTVSDTGQGIQPEFLPYVFDRFRQAAGTSNRAHGGLGLGLSIVRHLVELHGGSVRAASPGEGQGATFTVCLPLAIDHDPSVAGSPAMLVDDGVAACPAELYGLRVLIVDDQRDLLELLHDMLVPCGTVIQLCTNAHDALTTLRSWQPDVLVSDIAMPGQDGYWLIERVRELPPEEGGNIPSIALTAYVRMEDRLRVLAAGFEQYVPKPVEPVVLRSVLARLVRSISAD